MFAFGRAEPTLARLRRAKMGHPPVGSTGAPASGAAEKSSRLFVDLVDRRCFYFAYAFTSSMLLFKGLSG
jgi:hypothetical protein